jgi:hypothetical protein
MSIDAETVIHNCEDTYLSQVDNTFEAIHAERLLITASVAAELAIDPNWAAHRTVEEKGTFHDSPGSSKTQYTRQTAPAINPIRFIGCNTA